VRFLLDMDKQRRSRCHGLICACIVAAGVLLAHPVAEMGFQDDWSYIRTALEFARTGHFIFNGWATAMLGWMIPWGALFLRIFGFSFTAARMSMLPLAMATVYFFHATLARFGIGPRNSAFGALTLGFSPVFFPMAASYMSDIPGLLVIVLCLYFCLRAVQAGTPRSTAFWLCCAAAMGAAGGTARQTAWLGVLVMVPSTAWLLRTRPGVLRTGILLWAGGALVIAASLYWWNLQPYSVPEKIYRRTINPFWIHHTTGTLIKAFLCFLLLLAPLLVAWLGQVHHIGRKGLFRTAAIVSFFALFLIFSGIGDFWSMPWIPHLINSVLYGRAEFPIFGIHPLPLGLRIALSLLIVGSALIFIEYAFAVRAQQPEQISKEIHPTWQQIWWLLGPFFLAYLALLLPRARSEFLYDRYLLGIMPVAIIVLLRMHQQWVAPHVPTVSFAVMLVFAIVSICGTHDWFALNRARLSAIRSLNASGVPDRSIQAGFEYDGWTQIEAAGYVNEKRMIRPPGAYHEVLPQLQFAKECRSFFSIDATAIQPEYFVVSSPMPCFVPSMYPSVSYRAWLPPFHRTVYVQQLSKP
jgi:Dolichyl-phosphate-mannose-protein mannosyltransferase